jgi:tRNA 2-selenouridine synthase
MRVVDVAELWNTVRESTLLDVRTPSEFEQGHVPGAQNLPLFSDTERAEVGTLYKQVSPDEAFKRGLEFAGGKMRWYVEKAESLASTRRVVLHCWRGGQRSRSMAWLLNMAGFEVIVLKGGYKAYRRYQNEVYQRHKLPLLLLGGPTGSGKTDLLHELSRLGEQVIDLEGLARHKGSAFGAFGQEPQPTQQQFENDLFEIFRRQEPDRRVWLENESRAIGKNGLPEGFWEQMVGSPFLQLEVPFDYRVNRLVEEYGGFDIRELKKTFEQIRKRLGGQHVKRALEALDENDLAAAARVALQYYDKAYERSTRQMQFCKTIPVKLELEDLPSLAEKLIAIAHANGL